MKLLMHICCAPCANMPIDALRADGIDPEGPFGVGLAAVHIGIGRGMHDEVGPEVADARHHAWIGDVVAGQVQRQDGVCSECRQQLAAQLSVVAGDDHAHERSFLSMNRGAGEQVNR